ncbi:hypothetical protein BC828DRAFT_379580 [Blastocladiella britannica]|nr:hypothetical protein BC828DRAFT_379580 [Blastocladiella britannica]
MADRRTHSVVAAVPPPITFFSPGSPDHPIPARTPPSTALAAGNGQNTRHVQLHLSSTGPASPVFRTPQHPDLSSITKTVVHPFAVSATASAPVPSHTSRTRRFRYVLQWRTGVPPDVLARPYVPLEHVFLTSVPPNVPGEGSVTSPPRKTHHLKAVAAAAAAAASDAVAPTPAAAASVPEPTPVRPAQTAARVPEPMPARPEATVATPPVSLHEAVHGASREDAPGVIVSPWSAICASGAAPAPTTIPAPAAATAPTAVSAPAVVPPTVKDSVAVTSPKPKSAPAASIAAPRQAQLTTHATVKSAPVATASAVVAAPKPVPARVPASAAPTTVTPALATSAASPAPAVPKAPFSWAQLVKPSKAAAPTASVTAAAPANAPALAPPSTTSRSASRSKKRSSSPASNTARRSLTPSPAPPVPSLPGTPPSRASVGHRSRSTAQSPRSDFDPLAAGYEPLLSTASSSRAATPSSPAVPVKDKKRVVDGQFPSVPAAATPATAAEPAAAAPAPAPKAPPVSWSALLIPASRPQPPAAAPIADANSVESEAAATSSTSNDNNATSSGPITVAGQSHGSGYGVVTRSATAPTAAPKPPVPAIMTGNGLVSLADLVRGYSPEFAGPTLAPRGLINTGNMCFLNVILQPLVHAPPFRNLLRTVATRVATSLADTASGKTRLVDAFIDFIADYVGAGWVPGKGQQSTAAAQAAARSRSPRTGASTPTPRAPEDLVPEAIYNVMRTNKTMALVKGRQEDAEEFLGFLLEGLHSEFVAAMQKPAVVATAAAGGASARQGAAANGRGSRSNGSANGDDDGNDSGGEWLEVGGGKNKVAVARTVASADSPISKLFSGAFRSVLRVPGHKESITTQPFQSLPLDISPTNVQSVQDALRELIRPESIDEYPLNGKLVHGVTKVTALERVPPVLVLHLKRFMFDPKHGETVKIAKHVDVPHILDLEPGLWAAKVRHQAAAARRSSISRSPSPTRSRAPSMAVPTLAGTGRRSSVSSMAAPPQSLHIQTSAPPTSWSAAATTAVTSHSLMSPTSAFPSGSEPGPHSRYRLFAVVYHHGRTAGGGHYTCDVLESEQEGTWTRIDDTDLVRVPARDVVSAPLPDREPYLLFYECMDLVRRTDPVAVPAPSSAYASSSSASAQQQQQQRGRSTAPAATKPGAAAALASDPPSLPSTSSTPVAAAAATASTAHTPQQQHSLAPINEDEASDIARAVAASLPPPPPSPPTASRSPEEAEFKEVSRKKTSKPSSSATMGGGAHRNSGGGGGARGAKGGSGRGGGGRGGGGAGRASNSH